MTRFIMSFKIKDRDATASKINERNQVSVIENIDGFFELSSSLELVRLYRIDPVTAALIPVQTWTRTAVTV